MINSSRQTRYRAPVNRPVTAKLVFWVCQSSADLQAAARQNNVAHPLIPRIIHQTYRSEDVPAHLVPYMQTWADVNPGWEIRFYDDAACKQMIQREFPEYLGAYEALPTNVERADFFRYMVVLRYGGVHADIDTESIRPLDDLIEQNDTLLACWENEFATPQEAKKHMFVRQRQALQWAFAAAPGHPALRELRGDSASCDASACTAAGS
ncbi:hypothetical protein WJX73_004377 [Symbiochloris irregularis]|uniref:Uncharacterized protein n=1 Tax=Symbiochloris irregularis TaxID=706552 RepID=A0AAW1NRM4_9CHLO